MRSMDVAIIGAGIAGLFAAILLVNLAQLRRRIDHAVRW